jgi:hypothetical protein
MKSPSVPKRRKGWGTLPSGFVIIDNSAIQHRHVLAFPKEKLHGFYRITRSVVVSSDRFAGQTAARAGIVLSVICGSLSRIDGDSLGACGCKTDRLLRQSDVDQFFPGSGGRSDRREDKKIALWMAAGFGADQRCMAVGRPFRHDADGFLGEQVLHVYSSTRALYMPGGYLRQQRNRVHTPGSAHRITV